MDFCPDHRRGEQRCRFLSCRHLLWYCSCLEGVMDTSRLMLQWTLFPTPVSQNQQRKNIDDDQQQSQSIITSDIIPRTCTEQWRASERKKMVANTDLYTVHNNGRLQGTKCSYFSRRSKVDIPMIHLTIVDLYFSVAFSCILSVCATAANLMDYPCTFLPVRIPYMVIYHMYCRLYPPCYPDLRR
jgi:hypothetical protein